MTSINKIAQRWRKNNGYADKGGVVITYKRVVQAWVNELRDPQHWQPGCLATDTTGNQWQAVGGNAYDGAAEWQPIDATFQTQKAA
jgi:hypothetical protein